jgi:hypothetical protein
VILACLLAVLQTPEWRYVVPEPGDPLRQGTFAALALAPERPEDARIRVGFQGRPAFGQLRYGTPDSARVLVGLDRGAGEPRLYVDLDRDRALEPEELVAGTQGLWEVALPIGFGAGAHDEPPQRRVLFRLGATGTVFSCATLGYLEGRVRLGERELAARRTDGDANGFVNDPRDGLWLDLDADGEWESLQELFLFAPTLEIGSQRFTPRSDRLGRTLALEELAGSGRIQLALARAGSVRPSALSVLLVGRDGTSVGVRATGEPLEVPAGEYHVGMVSVWIPDAHGGDDWSFVFSEPGGLDRQRWFLVERDGLVTLDPLGQLELVAHTGGPIAAAPGARLTVRPALYTQDGLLINSSGRGRPNFVAADGGHASVSLLAADGSRVDAASSGFA